jgi:Ca2+-transporting ATPase
MIDRIITLATYYDVDVDTTLDIFKTSITKGLAEAEIPIRREKYGSNLLPRAKPKSIWRILFNQVKDLMIIILAVAAGASAGIGDYKATVALAAVIIINVIIGFTQEFKAEKALNSLLKLDVPQARVLREGEVSIIPAAELVPGDVVLLEEGAQVPADLRLCT